MKKYFNFQPQKQFCVSTLFLWFLFFSQNILAQDLTQTLRGVVADADTGIPLVGVTILLQNTEWGTATDENGEFKMEAIPLGRYSLEVSYTGFETLIISEILVGSGKETVLEITISEVVTSLQEIVVKSNVRNLRDHIFPSPEILTVDEVLRLPGTFYDPARLTFAYAGVANDNDQANGMVIRGNSPNSMSWRLEGVEIVNPNHTNNAGTMNDRVTQNGGGVNILSAQLLGNSTFMRGGFPAGYGNALSGIMDMRLRNGNNEQHEFTGQIGIIGIDMAAEGPFLKKSKASYLVNYRYSTLGLLGAMGVELGDEAISFQDLAFNFSFPFKNGGQITVFGMGGKSENIFEGNRDSTFWEEEKERFDINFESKMGAGGITFFTPIGEKMSWRNSIVYSTAETQRRSNILYPASDLNETLGFFDNDKLTQKRTSLNSVFKYKISSKLRLTAGTVVTQTEDFRFFNTIISDSISSTVITPTLGAIEGFLIQPYASWQYEFGKTMLNAGLHSTIFTFNNTQSLEPRVAFRYRTSEKQSIGFAYGLHSQKQLSQVYLTNINDEKPNENLKLTKSHHFSLAYENQVLKNTKMTFEMYFQSLFDVPISKDENSIFSALNLLDEIVLEELVNEGKGRNYGAEFSFQQYFDNNIYWLVNTSIYESKFMGNDGLWRDTRFNGNYIFNATFGKEFVWHKTKKEVVLGVNIRATYLGGFRDRPIDVVASELANTTIFETGSRFSEQRKDYFKIDLRVYWTANRKKINSTLALDIQNVTDRKNESFSYYDTIRKDIVVKNQLGIIPILSYRIEF